MPTYETEGNQISCNGMIIATCDEPNNAVVILGQVRFLNDVKRQYTRAARLLQRLEQLPGFTWINEEN